MIVCHTILFYQPIVLHHNPTNKPAWNFCGSHKSTQWCTYSTYAAELIKGCKVSSLHTEALVREFMWESMIDKQLNSLEDTSVCSILYRMVCFEKHFHSNVIWELQDNSLITKHKFICCIVIVLLAAFYVFFRSSTSPYTSKGCILKCIL